MPQTIESRTTFLRPLALAACALCLAGDLRADGTGWFTVDQVATGRVEYGAKCATCHGSQLQGTGAPALRGRSFGLQWNRKTLGDLYAYVHKQMPLGAPETLEQQDYADIVAFVLAQNGLPAGVDKFTPQTPMNRVLTLGPAARATLPVGPPSQTKLFELTDPVRQPSTAGPSQAELDAADAYEHEGRQYVAVASGNSGGSIPLQGASTIVIFGL